MKQIGIIGNGFVGGAVAYGFSNYEPRIYDIHPELSPNTLEEVLECDFVFICLPTPMVKPEGGECNLSIVENCLGSLPYNKDQVLILKSTVPVGATRKFSEKYNLPNLVHCPEFLTAANANQDFVNADRTIIGSPSSISTYAFKVVDLFKSAFPDIPNHIMLSDESELVKYASNCFLATKVAFFNSICHLAENLGINYDTIRNGVLADPRIGKSHTVVPGPDGNYGFGGTCFPKDTNALIKTLENNNVSPEILKAVWSDNLSYRQDWDWAESESAVKES